MDSLNVNASSKASARPIRRPSYFNQRTLWLVIFLGIVAWSIVEAGFGRDLINEGGWPLVQRFLEAGLHPDLSADFLSLTFEATLTTLAFAVCGTAISVILGSLGGLLVSEIWWQSVFSFKGSAERLPLYKLTWLGMRGLLAIPRAIHEIIWGLFFVNILGLVPLTAILAIGIPFGAITAKVFSEILDETPRQPMQALLNGGASPSNAFLYSLLPQAFPDLLSYTFYRFECSIRAAAVLGIIGAGGLGYQIFLSLQSLRYEQMWTLFIALFLLCGLTDLWSGLLRRRLGGASRLDLNLRTRSQPVFRPREMDLVVRSSLVGVVGITALSFLYLRPDFGQLLAPKTSQLLAGVARDSIPLHLDLTQIGELFTLSTQTLAMSILAGTGAGLAGIALSFPAARNLSLSGGIFSASGGSWVSGLWGRTVYWVSRALLLFSRAIPAPIWALILLFIMFPGILPGAIALGLYNFGILGRLKAEVVENLDDRPLRALKAQGAPESGVFLYGVLPATIPRFIAYSLYRWEVCIRATVIVGLVGAGGLGRLLTEQLSSFDYPGVAATLIVFVLLTFLVDLISASVRRVLR